MTLYSHQKLQSSLFEKLGLICCYSFLFLIGLVMASVGFVTFFFLASLTIPETFIPILLNLNLLWKVLLIGTMIISGICSILVFIHLDKSKKNPYLLNHFILAIFYLSFLEFLSFFLLNII